MTRSLLFCLCLAPALALAVTPVTVPKPKAEVLLDQPSAKVVRITLAPGAVLPEHTTPVHATVAALSGSGTVSIGGKTHPLPEHGAVFLPKDVPHDVKNPGTLPLVVLVHHLKTPKPAP